MEFWLCVLIGILIIIIFALVVKIILLQKSADEIAAEFADRLTTDTNTLIGISSRDRHMRRLAKDINIELNKLKKDRQRFQQGDLELKDAVTNISHDLRTPLTAVCGYLDLLEKEKNSAGAYGSLKTAYGRAVPLLCISHSIRQHIPGACRSEPPP